MARAYRLQHIGVAVVLNPGRIPRILGYFRVWSGVDNSFSNLLISSMEADQLGCQSLNFCGREAGYSKQVKSRTDISRGDPWIVFRIIPSSMKPVTPLSVCLVGVIPLFSVVVCLCFHSLPAVWVVGSLCFHSYLRLLGFSLTTSLT